MSFSIGIFGDSYADTGMDTTGSAWGNLLAKEFTVTNHSRSGTSLWWAYNTFLEHFAKYDVIIFSFTNPSRWPNLPKEYEGKEWNIGYVKENDYFIDKLNPYFWDLFPENLLQFINSAIHKRVTEQCISQTKYLISVIPFCDNDNPLDVELANAPFPVIIGLDKVSHMEEVMIDGKMHNTGKYLSNTKLPDHRACHLNPSNNKIIASWMLDCINQQKLNTIFDGTSYPNWIIHDEADSGNAKYFKDRK